MGRGSSTEGRRPSRRCRGGSRQWGGERWGGVVGGGGGGGWGTDVLKAVALGANAVLVGRPVLWGLAVGGEEGVVRVMTILVEELSRAMALAGGPNVGAV